MWPLRCVRLCCFTGVSLGTRCKASKLQHIAQRAAPNGATERPGGFEPTGKFRINLRMGLGTKMWIRPRCLKPVVRRGGSIVFVSIALPLQNTIKNLTCFSQFMCAHGSWVRGFRGKGVIKGAHLSVYDLDKVEGEFVLRADSERSSVAVACPTHFWWRVKASWLERKGCPHRRRRDEWVEDLHDRDLCRISVEVIQ